MNKTFQQGLKAAQDAINSKVTSGPLSGDGTDATAERNGLIQASNIIADLMKSQGDEMSEWTKVEIGNPLPDDDGKVILGPEDSMQVWAHWDDGQVEVATYHYISMDEPVFQRLCGTNEGCEGWNSNVGFVTHWMPYEVPKAPE